MSRYLTPSKLAVLILTRLYSQGRIPWSGRPQVLRYVAGHILPVCAGSNHEIESALQNIGALVVDFDQVKAILDPSAPENATPEESGLTLWDIFLDELWAMNSVDSLFFFFRSLCRTIVFEKRKKSSMDEIEGAQDEEEREAEDEEAEREQLSQEGAEGQKKLIKFSRTSPFGVFVRRSRLEFVRLPFHDVVRLWHSFVRFRAPTEKAWRVLNPNASLLAFDAGLDFIQEGTSGDLMSVAYRWINDEAEAEKDGKLSTVDIQRLMELQVEKLQHEGTRPSREEKLLYQKLIGERATVPSLAHYVRFFDASKSGDYASAFDNLHRYFDYAMQSRDHSHYQYALLHLAGLHAEFGCFEEALATMNETIATARENNDLHCLNFCLSWLHELVRSHPDEVREAGYRKGPLGSERQALRYLRIQAQASKGWGLFVSVLLSEARVVLSDGDPTPVAFELLTQASHLALNYQSHSNFGALWLLHAATYSRLGLTQLSADYISVLLDVYSDFISADDVVRARCFQGLQLARSGSYDEALDLFKELPSPSLSLRPYQYATVTLRLILLQRALARMELRQACALLEKLAAAPVPTPMRFDLAMLRIDFAVRRRDLDAAFEQVALLADRAGPKFANDPCTADVADRARILLLKAGLFALSNQAERGFSAAVRAAHVAARVHCMPVLWSAVAVMAEILNRNCQFGAARDLLDAVLPAAVEAAIAYGIGSASALYDALGDAWMGEAGSVVTANRTAAADGEAPSGSDMHDIDPASPAVAAAALSGAEPLIEKADEAFAKAERIFVTAQDISGRIRILQKRAVVADMLRNYPQARELRQQIERCLEQC